ncbi:MAG: YihY/virulence factor BrkB family protein [Halobacteriota archaeon]
MNCRIRAGIDFVLEVVDVVNETEVSFLAASIAYYVFVSLIPLLVLAFSAITFVGGTELEAEVTVLVEQYLLPTSAEQVLAVVQNTRGRDTFTVVGLAILLWSSLKLFRALDIAFSRVYGTSAGGFLNRLLDGVVALVTLLVGVIVVGVVSVAIALVPLPGIHTLGPALLLLALVVGFLPLYYVLPDVRMSPIEAVPGAVVAAFGWTLLGIGYGVYASLSAASDPSVYGALGGILLLVTWFYFTGFVVLIGAVVNAVLAERVRPATTTGAGSS